MTLSNQVRALTSIDGGEGDDFIQIVSGEAGFVNGGRGRDTIIGSNGTTAVDHLSGGDGNDTISGRNGKDLLQGEGGDDRLFGGADDDALLGGEGNDLLTGGLGNNQFVFLMSNGNTGSDFITDFDAGQGVGDVIRIVSHATIDTFNEVLAAADQVGNDVRIDLGQLQFITVENVNINTLVADDFLFL
jgi:Ca2+-binding RTX toxin-like protein